MKLREGVIVQRKSDGVLGECREVKTCPTSRGQKKQRLQIFLFGVKSGHKSKAEVWVSPDTRAYKPVRLNPYQVWGNFISSHPTMTMGMASNNVVFYQSFETEEQANEWIERHKWQHYWNCAVACPIPD